MAFIVHNSIRRLQTILSRKSFPVSIVPDMVKKGFHTRNMNHWAKVKPAEWKSIKNEFKAASQLLERSGISRPQQQLFFRRDLHTTSSKHSEKNKESSSSGNDEDGDDPKKQILARLVSTAISLYLLGTVLSLLVPSSPEPEMATNVSWNEFVHQMLAKGEVSHLVVRPDLEMVFIHLHSGSIVKGSTNHQNSFSLNIVDVQQFEEKLRETEASLGIKPEDGVPVSFHRRSGVTSAIILAIIVGLAIFYFSKSNTFKSSTSSMFSMGKAKYTMIDPLMPGSGKGVKLSHVAGCHEAKTEVMEFVDFLKNPSKYQRLGAKVPKGALLLGPPGCGKTMLAKAVATEGHVPFLAMNGPEFIEMIGGLGAARVRDLFKEAQKRSPCIIYIDEIDAIGRKRSSGASMDGSSQEAEQTLNQLLVEMDGILTKAGVVILASTNRLDILDKALLRPGRFDRHIMMDLPTQEERREIFEHHLKSIVLEKPTSYYTRRMATLTLGFSGAEIANVCNEAALHAARLAKTTVDAKDLEYAVERVVAGTEKRTQVLGKEEKKIVAYHEAGHALLGWLLEHTDGLLKVTIVPRTNQALGFAQYTPKDQKLYTQEQICEKMCMTLGGRVAEALTFNRITTGAQNDLEKVTKMAYAQVRTFGFSDRVGQVSYPEEESRQQGRRPYSNYLARNIDSEAQRLIFEAYQKTETILRENKDQLILLAEALLLKETLNYEDVVAVLGPPKFDKSYVEPAQFENDIQTWDEADK